MIWILIVIFAFIFGFVWWCLFVTTQRVDLVMEKETAKIEKQVDKAIAKAVGGKIVSNNQQGETK